MITERNQCFCSLCGCKVSKEKTTRFFSYKGGLRRNKPKNFGAIKGKTKRLCKSCSSLI